MSTICLECGYSITEPICASCVLKEVRFWLYEQALEDGVFKNINNKLKSLSNSISSIDYAFLPSRDMEQTSMMKCIKCKKGMHLMCSYCVTNQASKLIQERIKSEDSLESFKESFNMDIYGKNGVENQFGLGNNEFGLEKDEFD